jgi:hypothetical protein
VVVSPENVSGHIEQQSPVSCANASSAIFACCSCCGVVHSAARDGTTGDNLTCSTLY